MRYFPGNGEPIGFTHSTVEYMSVCDECSLTRYGNKNDRDYYRTIGISCEACGCYVCYVGNIYIQKHGFCGNPCEGEYFNKRKRDIRALGRLNKYCVVCNLAFNSKRADASTCSNKCRQKLYRFKQQTNSLKEKEPQLAKESSAEMSKAWAA